MTRVEHVEWAKRRALEYVDAGDLPNAIASMASDLSKHEDCRDLVGFAVMSGTMETRRGAAAVRRWVEGFN